MSNPHLDQEARSKLVDDLMRGRRAVKDAKTSGDPAAEASAHRTIDIIKQALGERGPVWWDDGAPDFNRHMAKNTPYADWYAGVSRRERLARS